MTANGPTQGPTVCAVVVTRNREDLLRECLTALGAQSRPLDRVLVVDNASTDETPRILRDEFPHVDVLTLTENEGGAGGFHEGMKRAHAEGFEWLWVMDDDTIPVPDALERLLEAPGLLDGLPEPVILASKVLREDERLHPFNQPRPKAAAFRELVEACDRGLLLIRTASFVSLLVHRVAVDRYGLPIKRYFIWNDDLEYTARVLRTEGGYLVPRSTVHHKSPITAGASRAGERFYYEVRNKLWVLRGDAWDPAERSERLRILYAIAGGSVDHLVHYRFRPKALAVVLRGWRDGLRDDPR